MLSVQVHPSDAHPDLLPAGETGKTEAWVVLKAEPGSHIYAGLKPGITAPSLQRALSEGGLTDHLGCFTPKPGDGVLLPAGSVHSRGGGVVVFEIQQNSDVTFRLYDWDHVDAKTGQPRALHVEQALSCIDFAEGPVSPVTPWPDVAMPARERLFLCEQFSLWPVRTRDPSPSAPRACRACSSASTARGMSSTMARPLPPAEATCCFCRRHSDRVSSGRPAR